MSEFRPIPIVESEELSDEDRRLIALFDKLEAGQLAFLDDANRRLVELSGLLLGILFGVLAFGDQFPPAYLVGSPRARWLALTALTLFFLALAAGVIGVQPRDYRRHTHNLDRLRDELARIIRYKSNWYRAGIILFAVASLALALLAASLIWTA